eukprot:GFKZ01005088.1.p1 GENE.GFKZ01005088.1~~GFKZ01005088.1.p1  ORF type:complete len:707 (-),score=71.92 GFKZ01005088.1:195-2315(-)
MLRPTTTRVPFDARTRSKSGLPFGLIVTPLAPSPPPSSSPLLDSEQAPHLSAAASTSKDVPRCAYCGAYISASCKMNTRYWRCSVCLQRNNLPARYSPTISAGPDAVNLIPELSNDLYNTPVMDQSSNDAPPTAYVFLLDESGDQTYLDAARTAIKSALDVIEGESLVGVMMYGRYLKFLDVRNEGVIRRICPMEENISMPTVFPPDQWLRLSSGTGVSQRILKILSKVSPTLLNPDNPPMRPMGPAVEATLDMIANAGLLAARIMVIGAGQPNLGKDSMSDVRGSIEQDRNRFPRPVVGLYSELGARAAAIGAMVDVYLVARELVDVTSLAPLAYLSGGRVNLYDGTEGTLEQDVWQHLNDAAVVRGMLRLRCSPWWALKEVYGSGVSRDAEVAEVFRIGCHGRTSTLATELEFVNDEDVSGDESKTRDGCVQVAFRGVFVEPGVLPQTVLRVETRMYGASGSEETVRQEGDANAVMKMMFHRALCVAEEQGIAEARVLLSDWLANLLAKTEVGSGEARMDGVLEGYAGLKGLPQLVFGAMRSLLFQQEAVSGEARAALRYAWEGLSPELLARAIYPRMYSFLNIDEKSNRVLPLSSVAVRESGHPIFLVDAFSEIVIYYAVSRRRDVIFPPPESSGVMRVRAGCARDRPVTPRFNLCLEGTPKDRWFNSLLIEDATPGGGTQSFSAFMRGILDAAVEIRQGLTQ